MSAYGLATWWIWAGFSLFLLIALTVDAMVMHQPKYSPHRSIKTALYWTILWISLALTFNVLLWVYLLSTTTPAIANKTALEFLAGYLIEESLSIDNLFVFYLIFHQLRIPKQHQQRVFSYGIYGAVIMRLSVILAGTWLVNNFQWVLYIMGAFLVFTGIRMAVAKHDEQDIQFSKIYKFLKRFIRVTHEFKDQQFFIRKNKLLYATPLFIAVIFIEISDIVFAFDSLPAIFSITTDPFIVWSSNIFAILGLRALYFCLAGAAEKFHLLKYGVALILIFVGSKMLIEPWVHVPVGVSLLVILSTLLVFSALSVKKR